MAAKLKLVAVFLFTFTGVFAALTALLAVALWAASSDQEVFGYSAVIFLFPCSGLFLVLSIVAALLVSHRFRRHAGTMPRR